MQTEADKRESQQADSAQGGNPFGRGCGPDGRFGSGPPASPPDSDPDSQKESKNGDLDQCVEAELQPHSHVTEQREDRESENCGIEGSTARCVRELVFWLHEIFMALPRSSS